MVVAHRVGERFGQAVSRSKGAHGGQVVVEVVGPCAVRMQRKGAVGPGVPFWGRKDTMSCASGSWGAGSMPLTPLGTPADPESDTDAVEAATVGTSFVPMIEMSSEPVAFSPAASV